MNVPKLRFKDENGQAFPAWEETTLGYISKNIMYGMNAAAIAYDGKNKYLRITDIDEEMRVFRPNPLSSPNGNIEERFKLKKGDLVVARTGASVGKSYLYRESDGNLLFAGFLIKLSITIAHPYFIFLKTLTEAYRTWLTIMSMRSGQPGINAEELREFTFFIPSLPEQTKIANFLSAVDDKIAELTKKVELLQRYKKGAMHQIFSQQLRFKDDNGQDFPEWEEKPLEAFLIPTPREVEKPRHTYLSIGVRSHCKGTFQRPEMNPEKNVMDNLFQVKENDLVVSITFAWEGAIAIVKKEDHNGLVSQRFPTYTFVSEITNHHFFQYVFVQAHFRKELELISPGGAGRNRVLSKKDFLKITCLLPCLPEQTKIANFLSALDEQINTSQQQLDATKQYKKSLLQQMFI